MYISQYLYKYKDKSFNECLYNIIEPNFKIIIPIFKKLFLFQGHKGVFILQSMKLIHGKEKCCQKTHNREKIMQNLMEHRCLP